ncbi:succinyl-CoA--3-ketoacid-CoA transferase, partial [bacterium]|nr:succinyl-CoA--3-ketoacid-CoA transferase [bacterium]
VGVVKRIVTELAVIDVTSQGFELLEYAPGVSIEAIKKATAAPLRLAAQVKEIQL